MLTTSTDHRLALELARRLEKPLQSCAHVIVLDRTGWSIAKSTDTAKEIDPVVLAALEGVDTTLAQPIVARVANRLVVAANVCPNSERPVVVAFNLPDENEGLIRSLVTANLEAMLFQEEATRIQTHSEFFIDQVTQDFEELTWLRNTHEYFDLCGTRHTIDSIAKSCLPELAKVINAGSILFVRSRLDDEAGKWIPDWDKVLTTSSANVCFESCKRFLMDSMDTISREPRVANCKASEEHLPGYPGIRHCIAMPVSKGARFYGWILAINKMPNELAVPVIDTLPSQLVPISFGTFEAGLLSAAANIMSSHSRNLELLKEQESLLTGVVRACINAIDAKDPYTCGHSDRVAMFAKRIAAKLGTSADECEQIYMAGLLHDIGKIGVPDWILGKPGKLTEEEFAIVKKHPEIGYGILKHLKQLDYVLPGVLHHHESVDGSGYPHGLVGETIPMQGRILAVADAYDAMTSDRPYRIGMPSEKAESILRAHAGKIWDSDVVAAFMECLATDPASLRKPESFSGQMPRYSPDGNFDLMVRIEMSINSMAEG